MRKTPLDALLRDWAARHAADEGEARGLASRVTEELARRRVTPPGPGGGLAPSPLGEKVPVPVFEENGGRLPGRGRPGSQSPARRAWAVAAAACLVLAAAALAVLRTGRNGGPDAAQLAGISTEELAGDARLFGELERLFDGDLRSAVESGTTVRLDIAPVAGGPAIDAVPLLLRVAVACRRAGEATWEEPVQTDVLTRTEELVDVVPDTQGGNRILLWAYRLPDGHVAVDASIRLTTPVAASADVTTILTPGKARQVLALKTREGECRVLLNAAPLACSSRPERQEGIVN